MILLDGVDLREYSVEDLCSQIGVIFKLHALTRCPPRATIGVGRIEDPILQDLRSLRRRVWRMK